jgi:pentatricopeptide repeat protein
VCHDHFIRFFGSLGTLFECSITFPAASHPSIYTWHAIISSHALHGEHRHALALYCAMLRDGITPNRHMYTCVLKACGALGIAVMHGEAVHDSIARHGFEACADVVASMVDMYASCGRIEDARKVFDSFPLGKDGVLWTAFLDGLVRNGCADRALQAVKDMQSCGRFKPDKVTFLSALRACGLSGSMLLGSVLHAQIMESALETEIVVANALIDMYSKCGALNDACSLFDELKTPSIVSWGAMITAFASHGRHLCALRLLEKMHENHVETNHIILMNLLKACAGKKAIDEGRVLHHHIIEGGMEMDCVDVDCTLIDMYAKCGSVDEAHSVFDMQSHHDAVSWDAIIVGYAHNGHDSLACKLFRRMQKEGVKPELVTYACLLKSVLNMQVSRNGKHLHHGIIHDGFEHDEAIGNLLLDMYAKLGGVEDALRVFDSLKNVSKVSWSALMEGYVEHGDGLLGLQIFSMMEQTGIELDRVAYLCALKACSLTSTGMHGRLIHDHIIRSGHENGSSIGNALIHMYVKCLCVKEAGKLFDCSAFRDIEAWGAMVYGYAMQGNYRSVDLLFEAMQQHGLKPNDVMFTSILSACCQESAVKQGEFYFNRMESYGVKPTVEHVTCMIDLLGGAGYLDAAKQILNNISASQCSIMGWMSLLTACRGYGNVQLGRQCFDKLVLLNPGIGAMYILMLNIYGSDGTSITCEGLGFHAMQGDPCV